jgi:hypothetical protein
MWKANYCLRNIVSALRPLTAITLLLAACGRPEPDPSPDPPMPPRIPAVETNTETLMMNPPVEPPAHDVEPAPEPVPTEPEEPSPPETVRRFWIGEPALRYPLVQEFDQVHPLPDDLIQVSRTEAGQLRLTLPLTDQEAVWGFGQRFDAVNMRGKWLESWATDGWNRLDTSYFAVPFFISSEGYGLFVNHPGRITFDIGADTPGQLVITIPDTAVELIHFLGTPAEVTTAYTERVGRPRSAPHWIFRPWMSRNSYYGADEVTQVIRRMERLGMPVGVVVLEAWAEQLHNFAFERRRYPLPITWIRELRQQDVHVVCWITPSVWTNSRAYEEARENGWLVLNEDGSEYVTRWLENGRKIDFRIPEARAWWRDLQVPLVRTGISGIKTDGGEHMPDPDFHNAHPYYYQQASLDAFALAEQTNGITFARSAGPLNAGLGAFWAGDQLAEWSRLAAVVRAGIGAAYSGFPLWGHDIGAYSGEPEKDLYIRWLQFGAFSPIMHFHGETAREPWHYDEETRDIARFYFAVRERLQPFLRKWGEAAVTDGIPILRPLPWHFPEDTATYTIEDQYFFGPDILVAPVVNDAESRSVYLPEGNWTDLWTGTSYTGPEHIAYPAALHQIPLFVRTEAGEAYADLLADGPEHLPPEEMAIELIDEPDARGMPHIWRHMRPGQQTELVTYRLTNLMETSTPVGARLAAPAGVHVHPRQIIRFLLEPGESRNLQFEVMPGIDIAPGTYPLSLEVRTDQRDWPTPAVQLVVPPLWQVIGPFAGGVGSEGPLDPAAISLRHPEEGHTGQPIRWQTLPPELVQPNGMIDLEPLLGAESFTSCYLYTEIHSEWPRRIQLFTGSGDGLTVWVNGRQVLDRPVHRNPTPEDDRMRAVLLSGRNQILVRVHRDLAKNQVYLRIE